MIIFDEKKYVEDILRSNNAGKMGIKTLITYIAKYYYEAYINLTNKQYVRKILDRMNEFEIDPHYYQEYQYAGFTKSLCNKLRKGKIPRELFVVKEVAISRGEMNLVRSAPSQKAQKLLFTLYVLSKTRRNPNGWVNYEIRDIFKLANINVSTQEKYKLFNQLAKYKLIGLSHVSKKSAFKVELIEGPPEIIISEFNNIGNQYVITYNDDWIMCRECGRLVKVKNKIGRPLMYCKQCAKMKKYTQSVESVYNSRQIVGKNSP